MPTVLHHLSSSRSDSIFWLLEELGIQYEVVMHWRTPLGTAPESLKEVFPLGKAPVVVEDGKALAESGAIVHYFISRHGAGVPGIEDPAKSSHDSIYWSHFAEGSLMLQLQPAFVASKIQAGIASAKITWLLPFFQKGATTFYDYFMGVAKGNVTTYLAYIETFLGEHSNFSGSKDVIGEGDFMMYFPLRNIARSGKFELGPNTQNWLKQIQERPALKRALERQAEEEKTQAQKEGE